MLNINEEIKAIKILGDFKNLLQANSNKIIITKFEIIENKIRIHFSFYRILNYFLNLEYMNDSYEISFFKKSKRPIRMKLIEGKEVQSIYDCLLSDFELNKYNVYQNDSKPDVNEQLVNFNGFLLIFTNLLKNLIKNGISILTRGIHEIQNKIIFNYNDEIIVILESNNFTFKLKNEEFEYRNNGVVSGITLIYSIFLSGEIAEYNEYSLENLIMKRIQKLEDEYYGK